jgi:hypothetical protein
MRARSKEELKDFQRKVSDAGGATHNASTGAHDDQRAADRAIAKMTGLGLRDAVSIAAGLHSRTSYSNAAPSGSFSSNHVSAASGFAKTYRWSGSPACLLVLT